MKGKWAVPVIFSILILGGLGFSQQVFAFPITVSSIDEVNCDPLFVDPFVDELGWSTGITALPGPFPPDEAMDSADISPPPFKACPTSGFATAGPDVMIEITNLSGHDWPIVWYVGDFDTSVSNLDGFVDGAAAFQIDSSDPTCLSSNGVLNTPLVAESFQPPGLGNCIFEAGETWTFIIDGYFEPSSGPPELFDSLGISAISVNNPPSTGSIIVSEGFAFVVGGTSIPINTTTLLLAGASLNVWMIPVILSAAGFGILIARKI